jgi:hypothetical protein
MRLVDSAGSASRFGQTFARVWGLGSFGTAGEELATEIDLQFWRKNFTHL